MSIPRRVLRFGPYAFPVVTVGAYVTCAVRGRIRIHHWRDTEGAIPWPVGVQSGPSPGAPSIVVMGDLVRALKREAAVAVAQHWGVSRNLVRRWRRALGIDRYTEGTRRILADGGNMAIGELAHIGASASLVPDIRRARDATHAETMRAKPSIRRHMRRLVQRRRCRQCHRFRVVTAVRDTRGRFVAYAKRDEQRPIAGRKPVGARLCRACFAEYVVRQRTRVEHHAEE